MKNKIQFIDHPVFLKIQVKTKKGILDIIKGVGSYSDWVTWEIGLLDKTGDHLIYNKHTSNSKTDLSRGWVLNDELNIIINKLDR